MSAPAPGEGGSLKGLARWRADQRYALREARQTLRAQTLGTALIALTLALALLLPAALGRVLALTEGNLAHWPTTPRINVFFGSPEPPATLLARWRAHREIAALQAQSSEASRAEFRAALGMETALSRGLAGEAMPPLPSVVIVTPRPEAQSAARLKALAEELSREAGALGVQVDLAWVERLQGTLGFFTEVLVLFQGLLTAAVVLLVGALTRMALLERLPALRTLRLLGASDGFLLAPFLYQALAYGVAGGLLAALSLLALESSLTPALQALATAYALPLAPGGSAALAALSVLAQAVCFAFLGALGAGLWVLGRFDRLTAPSPGL
ncbi:MAG: hypothetical protein ISQ02_07745 [Pseudomonadales bacterium]|nr:hypothetical protein [Pseudomonadales bacterium]